MPCRISGPILAVGILSSFTQQVIVPFDVCVQSDDWKRPSTDAQSKIWNDPRYRELGPRAYEWTHNFLSNEPDSASLAYSSENLSGLWTQIKESQCPRRDRERNTWTEVWVLNYRVTEILLNGLVYSVTVIPQDRGYEIMQFRRPSNLNGALTSLDFVTPDGAIVDHWKETSPSVFVATTR